MFDSSSPIVVLAGWRVRPLAEVESAVWCLPQQSRARDRPVHQAEAPKQGQRRVVEDTGLAGLSGQRRLAGEGLEPLVAKLELDRSRRELVPAEPAGDRFGQVEQGGLETADVG